MFCPYVAPLQGRVNRFLLVCTYFVGKIVLSVPEIYLMSAFQLCGMIDLVIVIDF